MHLANIRTLRPNPVRTARGLAMMHVAIYDAVIATWHYKYMFHRQPPRGHGVHPAVEVPNHPSYPSEHAAIAGAASRVLAHLFFPDDPAQQAALDLQAEEAAMSRLHAGANFRSDIEAGLALGREVAALVLADRVADGSQLTWDCVSQPGRITGPGFWEPNAAPFGLCPPSGQLPTDPLAGDWKPFVIRSTAEFLSAPPPGYVPGPPPTTDVNALLEPAQEIVNSVNLTGVVFPRRRALRPTTRRAHAAATWWRSGPARRAIAGA